MNLALLGFGTVAIFVTLIMMKRLSAIAALIALPIVAGLLAGHGPALGDMMLKGVTDVAPIAIMLAFAILYFGLMMDAGLFDPLVRGILRIAGDDPLRIAIGTTALTSVVSLDGDGTTTAIIVISAMLPLYRATGMNPLILATLLGLANALLNFVPWGGPAARAATALKVDLVGDIFIPLLPTLLIALAAVFALAWWFGISERRRLGWVAGGAPATAGEQGGDQSINGVGGQPGRQAGGIDFDRPERRPRLFWINLLLTIGLVAGMATGIAPLPVLIMSASVIALTLNYPTLAEQKDRLAEHAYNIVMVVLLIFAAGAFTGIMSGTGMIDAMARALLTLVPPALGPAAAVLVALLAMPFTFVMSNDAYYFGIVPVLAQTAAGYGIPAEAIARASLLGQPVHQLSPLLAPVYLACGLIGVDVADAQRFALKYAVLLSLVLTLSAVLTGAVPLSLR